VRLILKNRSCIGEHWEGDTMFDCPQLVDREVYEGVQRSGGRRSETATGVRLRNTCSAVWCFAANAAVAA
jgi:hypothetical protein